MFWFGLLQNQPPIQWSHKALPLLRLRLLSLTLFKVLHRQLHKYILLTAGPGTFLFHPNIKPT